MAKNYGKKMFATRNPLSQLFGLTVAFVVGYICATWFDFNHLTQWLGQQFFAQQTPILTKHIPKHQTTQLPKPKFEFYTLLAKGQSNLPSDGPGNLKTLPSLAPKPMEMTVAVPATRNSSQVAPLLPATVEPTHRAATQQLPLHAPFVNEGVEAKTPMVANLKGGYLIQVASFRNLQEAQKMKAGLVMKGFDVSISQSMQRRVNWYRVMIGPYASQAQAQKIQLSFARSQHIMGMIRKIDL